MSTKKSTLINSSSLYNLHGKNLLKRAEKTLKFGAFLLLCFYRSFLTAIFGGACRFEPSCSEYARQAFHKHSLGKAFVLTFKRLVKCRPGGPYGYDPVPPPCCEMRLKQEYQQ